MSDVLVVFGSSSDKSVYRKIMRGLKAKGIKAGLRICSAHRTPKQLDSIVAKSNAKLFIAGAGLSAALPGAIASRTLKPVIGVPVAANYAGLDALLSVAQMPSGFPVIAVGVNSAESAVEAATLALQQRSFVKVAGNRYNKTIRRRINSASAIANKIGLHFEFVESLGKKTFNPKEEVLVNLAELAGFRPVRVEGLVLNVPILRESSTPEALEFFENSKTGLWLGLNRVDNALIAAAQLLNIHSRKFSGKLQQFRKGLQKKTIKADAKERKRV